MFRKCVTVLSVLTSIFSGVPSGWSATTVFRTAVNNDTGTFNALSFAVADVNRDGKLDVVVNGCVEISCQGGFGLALLLGNGDATFQPPLDLHDASRYVALADLNADGNVDLLEIQGTDVVVRLGNGDGTFQLGQRYASGGGLPVFLAVGDVNRDHKLDLVVASECRIVGCGPNGVVSVLLGKGDGTFRSPKIFDAGGRLTVGVAIADLNDDNKPDLIVGNDGGFGQPLTVMLGNGDGTFQSPIVVNSFGSSSIAVGDLNGDGKPDLAVSIGGAIFTLLGNGDGTFQSAQAQAFADEVAIADVNRDGKSDLITAQLCIRIPGGTCASGRIYVLLGNGDGTFQTPQIYKSGGDLARAIALADLNVDGKVDLLVVNSYQNLQGTHGSVAVLMNKYLAPTTTILASSPNPSKFSQPVTLKATVTSTGLDLPTGKVTFKSNGIAIGSAMLTAGVASFTTTKLPVGTLSLSAVYHGDIYSARSTFSVLVQVVNP
jgi:hypothetical protein